MKKFIFLKPFTIAICIALALYSCKKGEEQTQFLPNEMTWNGITQEIDQTQYYQTSDSTYLYFRTAGTDPFQLFLCIPNEWTSNRGGTFKHGFTYRARFKNSQYNQDFYPSRGYLIPTIEENGTIIAIRGGSTHEVDLRVHLRDGGLRIPLTLYYKGPMIDNPNLAPDTGIDPDL